MDKVARRVGSRYDDNHVAHPRVTFSNSLTLSSTAHLKGGRALLSCCRFVIVAMPWLLLGQPLYTHAAHCNRCTSKLNPSGSTYWHTICELHEFT
jgi:hypothetical protein